jgi:hypothetical protein
MSTATHHTFFKTKARSRVAGYHYLSSAPPPNPQINQPLPPLNGSIHILYQILREVVSSAAEAELAGCFHNGKDATALRICLQEMGHPQPATIIVTENSTATGIANDTVKQKLSKAIDMRFYWIRDRVRKNQFQVRWVKGELNRADYYTKYHPPSHHRNIRSAYHPDPTQQSPNYFECLTDDSHNLLPTVSHTAPVVREGICARLTSGYSCRARH